MGDKELIPISDWQVCVVKTLDDVNYQEAMYRRVGDHIEIKYSYNYYAQDFKFN
jgi:hypothetical protein